MQSPIAQYLSMLTSITLLFWATLVKAESGRHLAVLPEAPQHALAAPDGRAVAPANVNSRITGCIGKDNRAENVTYELKVGNDFSNYSVKGSTDPNQGIYRTDSDYRGVEVTKITNEDGLTRITPYDNVGTVKIYPRKRMLENAKLAGIPIEGHSVAKLFTNSLVMENLKVNGEQASGKLGYNIFTGTYKCTKKNCKFGKYAIASTEPNSTTVLNYDHFINQNRMRVTMKFGDLKLNGNIKFTDNKVTHTDSDGGSTTEVTATKACFNVDVKKADGTPLDFAKFGKADTRDDEQVRHVIAWLQLNVYDLLSE